MFSIFIICLMKKIQANKRHKKTHSRQNKKIQARQTSLMTVKKRAISRKKIFSPYPYIITVSYYKTNVFFSVADIEGQTKAWTSTGRSDFKNKDKTTYMAVIRVTELFYRRLWNLGIRRVLFKFHNLRKRNTRFAVKNGLRKIRKSISLKYLGFFARTQLAFNGCRKKKKRRK